MIHQPSEKHSRPIGQICQFAGFALAAVVAGSLLGAAGADDTETINPANSTTTFRRLALQLFDTDHNGRLDSREQAAATRALLSRHSRDPQVRLLRQKALEEFDANENGKLERQEIRAALRSVNRSASTAHRSHSADHQSAASNRNGDPTSVDQLAKTVQQQIMRLGGMDADNANFFALANFDSNGNGVLDWSELVAAAAALQQYAQAQAAQQLLSVAPLALTIPASTTTSTTTASGTGTTTTASGSASSSTSMCSSSGSGGSSSSSGTNSSSGTSGQTNAARSSSNSNNTLTPSTGPAGFGGFGGGFAGFRGFRGR